MSNAFGRYRLLERLGQGGMAEVFKAKSFGVEGFEKVLVIKRILPELARSQRFVDMFIYEAKLAVRLSHANIVQVFDLGRAPVVDAAGQHSDAYYIAMEFVHGIDLATALARCRRRQTSMPLEMAVYACAEVVKGLDHAHRRRDEQLRPLGIVHRDVSPQNVLLSFEGEVKVTDFGIAKARGAIDELEEESTRARQLHGKFGYMSPEQARGESVDGRSDLFSLGIVLYECVAGVNPFSAPTAFETLRRVQACEYPPVELLRPEVPAELVAILKVAMAKNPADRYPDAGRMYEALLAFLYSQGSRYGAHELSDFLVSIEGVAADPSGSSIQILDEGSHIAERTPVEVPPGRSVSSVSVVEETGVRSVSFDLTGSLGERREVSALVIEFPRGQGAGAGDRAIELVLRYGGRVHSREADQIIGLFGLGEPDGRDTEMATRCAMVALRAQSGAAVASAGVHTARIHVGPDGAPTDDERLSGLVASACALARAREGAVAVSGAAMRQLKNIFVFDTLNDGTQPSGVAGAIVKDVRGAAETFGRFVGRKDELRRVGEVLAAATRRAARALTVRGAHGIGKTRLLYEVERRLVKGGYNVGWYVAICPPRGRDIPLSGIVCMLQVLCGIADGDHPDRVMALQPRLRATGLQDDEVAAVLAALGGDVALSSSSNAKTALRSAFARMVASLCEDKPHTFAWDAAHCMDEDSSSILESALSKLKSSRVVFALSAREGFSHPLEQSEGHVALDLADLAPDDVARLIPLRLGTEVAPDALVRFVRDRAGGHPLFIEEVIKALLDVGAVTVADGKVVSMRLVGQELALPKTLRGLVALRVARLSAGDRPTLQAAAVLGESIAPAVVAEMLAQPLAVAERSLDALLKAELLVRVTPTELRVASPLIREVVLDALPHEAFRELHAAAGAALERSVGDRTSEQASRIATHFYEAGDREQAATHFAKSGERKFEARQLEAAVRDFSRAIELCDMAGRPPAELAAWLDQLAQAVGLVRAAPEAQEMCDRIIARLDAGGDSAIRVRARVNASRILVALHKFEAAAVPLEEAERVAQGDDELMKLVLVAAAEMAGRRGDFAGSLELLKRMQGLVTREADKHVEHKVLVSLAQAHAALGDRVAALSALERAEALLPVDPAAACERQKLRGLVFYFTRDFRAACAESERGVDLARALGLSYEVAVNLHNVGDTLLRLEDFARAYGALQQSLALCDEYAFDRLASHNQMLLAYLAGLKGDEAAEKQLVEGVRYAEANEFSWDVISGRYFLARLMQKRRGDDERARREFEELRTLALAKGHKLVVDDCEDALKTLATLAS